MARKLKTIVRSDIHAVEWGIIARKHVKREFDEQYFYPKPHALALIGVLVKDVLKRVHTPPLSTEVEDYIWNLVLTERSVRATDSSLINPVFLVELVFKLTTDVKALSDSLYELQDEACRSRDEVSRLRDDLADHAGTMSDIREDLKIQGRHIENLLTENDRG